MENFPSRKTLVISFVILIALVVSGMVFWKGGVKNIGGLKPFIISGKSMEPTIKDGDEVFTDLSYYKTHPIEKGDIVAIQFSLSSNKIKRVVAVDGDKVEFTADGTIKVNGISSPSGYLKDSRRQFDSSRLRILKIQLGEKGIVPTNSLLVLGDNRIVSEDSQQFGLVPAEQVMGKIMCKKTKFSCMGV